MHSRALLLAGSLHARTTGRKSAQLTPQLWRIESCIQTSHRHLGLQAQELGLVHAPANHCICPNQTQASTADQEKEESG